MRRVLLRAWALPLKALAIAVVIGLVRLGFDQTGIEHISLSPLIATIITADVFILGFLLSGVMSDYKESERLPGDLATSIGVIADECLLLWRHKSAAPARACLEHVAELTGSLRRWFNRTERTARVAEEVNRLGDYFAALEEYTAANYLVRLKQEQSAISRMLVRVHTIRETTFVSSGYMMARLVTASVLLGLLVIKVEPWYESVFLVGVIGWLLSYLILLINDLDNPFDYGADGRARGQEVSLKPIDDLGERIAVAIQVADQRVGTPLP